MTRVLALLFFACYLAAAPVSFQTDVQPILEAKCKACHGGDKRSGGFTIREYNEMLHGGRSGAPVMPGDPKDSLLLQRITGERTPVMPLGGAPLTASEIAVIRNWIADGARLTPDGPPAKAPWIAKLALTAPPIPQSKLTHPIDRFLDAYYQKQGVAMPGTVSDAVFARRAYLDIWGLLPPPADVARFSADTDSDKRAKLIDRLLANNTNYAENWISYWNDLLRNDGGARYAGVRKSITDWLYKALESNEPYNQFVSDLLNPPTTPDSPEGFLLGVNWRGDVNASQTPIMQAAQNTAQVFLGINLKCNSCHDSFISKWKLKDAYSLAAYFADKPNLELVRCDNPTGKYTTASFLYPELNPSGPAPDSLSARHALVASLFTDPRNGRTPRTLVNRYWARLIGRGIVLDVDDLDSEPWDPELLDWLASDFVSHGYDLKQLLRTIMTSRAYQMPAIKREKSNEGDYVFRGPELRRLTAEQIVDAIGTITGEWEVAPEPGTTTARYSRDWRVQSTTLTRALGRPIRDQVYTERDCSSTTLQSLELVNGEVITRLLNRGAARMLGQVKAPPLNLFDSGKVSSGHVEANLDISNVDELHLVVADVDSYSPERVLPVWADAMVERNGTWAPLSDAALAPVQMKGAHYESGIRAGIHSDLVFDLRGKGYTRFKAVTGVEEKCVQSDISPAIRFFVFAQKPDWDHLVRVAPETPVVTPPTPRDPDALITQLWRETLDRTPTPAERKLAREALRQPGGLADLLWSLLMLPEFQLIG